MIIPVKCFTCGKVLADKYLFYKLKVREEKAKRGQDAAHVVYLTQNNVQKTPEGEVLDKLGFNKMCCRRHMLCHVDIE